MHITGSLVKVKIKVHHFLWRLKQEGSQVLSESPAAAFPPWGTSTSAGARAKYCASQKTPVTLQTDCFLLYHLAEGYAATEPASSGFKYNISKRYIKFVPT